MKNFVDCTWLSKHMEDKDVFIIDCRFDLFNASYGRKAYNEGHIKNAFYFDINEDFAGEKKTHGGARPIPELSVLGKKLADIGIKMDSTIVFYDDKTYSSARAWWQLKYMGFKNIYILNGGYQEWKKLGLPVSTDVPDKKSNGRVIVKPLEKIYCDKDYVESAIKNPEIILLDSREKRRYTGEYEPLYSKNGHIPGALNFHWEKNLDDGKIKSTDMLSENFSFVKDLKEIIVYCGSGIDAAVNFVVLDELGYNVKLYVGSVSDWISYEENILEIGEK